jgi:hypothetical protein
MYLLKIGPIAALVLSGAALFLLALAPFIPLGALLILSGLSTLVFIEPMPPIRTARHADRPIPASARPRHHR